MFACVCKHACQIILSYYAISRLAVLFLTCKSLLEWRCLEGKNVTCCAERETVDNLHQEPYKFLFSTFWVVVLFFFGEGHAAKSTLTA